MCTKNMSLGTSTDDCDIKYTDVDCNILLETSETLYGKKLKIRVPKRALRPRRNWKLDANADAQSEHENLLESSGSDLDTAKCSTIAAADMLPDTSEGTCFSTDASPESPDDRHAPWNTDIVPNEDLIPLLNYPELFVAKFVSGRPWDGVTDLLTEEQPEHPAPRKEVCVLEAEREEYGRQCQSLAWKHGKIWTWASALKYEPPTPVAQPIPTEGEYVLPQGSWQYFFACQEKMQALKMKKTYSMAVCPPHS